MPRHKFGYFQQSVFSRSKTHLDQQMTLILMRLCYDVYLLEVSLQ